MTTLVKAICRDFRQHDEAEEKKLLSKNSNNIMLTNQPAHIIERQALVATDGEALVVMAPGSEEQELAAGAGLRPCRREGDGPRRPSSPCRSCARYSRDQRSGAASTASSRRRTLSDSHRPRASWLQRYAFSFFPASIKAEKLIGSVGMGR